MYFFHGSSFWERRENAHETIELMKLTKSMLSFQVQPTSTKVTATKTTYTEGCKPKNLGLVYMTFLPLKRGLIFRFQPLFFGGRRFHPKSSPKKGPPTGFWLDCITIDSIKSEEMGSGIKIHLSFLNKNSFEHQVLEWVKRVPKHLSTGHLEH